MPRYEYQCSDCLGKVTLVHSSKVDRTPESCVHCGIDLEMKRVYSFSITKAPTGKAVAGDLVKTQIEESRRELKKEKEELTKKDYAV